MRTKRFLAAALLALAAAAAAQAGEVTLELGRDRHKMDMVTAPDFRDDATRLGKQLQSVGGRDFHPPKRLRSSAFARRFVTLLPASIC